jgi:TetR/AcrR family transcriptional regulator, transcriptional repressor for nem operon
VRSVPDPGRYPRVMVEPTTERRVPRLTSRGATTRARIIDTAAGLMRVKGVQATSLDEVRVASGTSKSQLYYHFPDKDALVRAVTALQAQRVLERERQRLERLSTLAGLRRWRDTLVQVNRLQNGAYGCVLGSLANELADRDDEARAVLADGFSAWERLLAEGLRRMQANGTLRADADADMLSTGLFAALQGGYLLARTAHDVAPMEAALDMALDQISSYAADSPRG